MTAQGQILAQVAKMLGVDLDLVRQAEERSRAVEGLAAAAERVISAFNLADDEAVLAAGDGQISSISVQVFADKLTIVIGNDFVIDLPRRSTATESGNSATATGSGEASGNWGEVVELAAKYGVTVSESVRQRISYYVGRIIRSCVKKSPEAKNDIRLRQLAEKWMRESRAAQSQGFRSLADFGFDG